MACINLSCGKSEIAPMLSRPASTRGALRDRHDTRGGMRWTLWARETNVAGAYGEGVWSWHPWAGAKSASDDLADDGDYEVMDTGESAQETVKPLRREGRMSSVEPVVTAAC